MTNEIITLVLRLIVALCGVLVTKVIIPWIQGKIGMERFTSLSIYAGLAVKAAEQTFGCGMGPEKKSAVREYIVKKAADLGVILTGDDIDKMIEAAVLEIKALGMEAKQEYDQGD